MCYKSNINKHVLEHAQTVVFDLDRTLIKQDSLIEQLKVIFRVSKSDFFSSLLFLVSQGRVLFKKNAKYESLHRKCEEVPLKFREIGKIFLYGLLLICFKL